MKLHPRIITIHYFELRSSSYCKSIVSVNNLLHPKLALQSNPNTYSSKHDYQLYYLTIYNSIDIHANNYYSLWLLNSDYPFLLMYHISHLNVFDPSLPLISLHPLLLPYSPILHSPIFLSTPLIYFSSSYSSFLFSTSISLSSLFITTIDVIIITTIVIVIISILITVRIQSTTFIDFLLFDIDPMYLVQTFFETIGFIYLVVNDVYGFSHIIIVCFFEWKSSYWVTNLRSRNLHLNLSWSYLYFLWNTVDSTAWTCCQGHSFPTPNLLWSPSYSYQPTSASYFTIPKWIDWYLCLLKPSLCFYSSRKTHHLLWLSNHPC